MLLVRVVAVDQKAVDLAVVAEAVLGGQALEEVEHVETERRWMATDQERHDLGVVVVLERPRQRELAVVRDGQTAWSRKGLDQRQRPVAVDQSTQRRALVPLEYMFGDLCPAGAARVSVRSGVEVFACSSFEGLQCR